MRFFLLPLVAGLLIISFSINTQAYTFVYDDFSDSNLDLTQWKEETNRKFPEKHYVNTSREVFHVEQPVITGDTTHHLIMKEGYDKAIIEYDLNYISGSGNHLHNFDIVPHANANWCPGHCYIGYWNQNGIIGSQKGLYHLKFHLDSSLETIFINITRPDGSYWTLNDSLAGEPKPYHFLMQTGTGHNGVMHYDIDNVKVTVPGEAPEPPCNCSELEERIGSLEEELSEAREDIDSLEERVEELEGADCAPRLTGLEARMDSAEAAISALQGSLALLEEGLDLFRETIVTYLTHAPLKTRKDMVCGYMEDNGLDEHSALGLECEIREFNFRKWSWSYCFCE